MNYSDLNKETQLYLNKAMDIYSIIRDKSINKYISDYSLDDKNYEFRKLDKKLLSLFIAGFLTEGNLKEVLSEYDDIKLEDLLDFVNLNEEEIKPMPDGDYESFFEKKFKLELMNYVKKECWGKKVNFITPEVIVVSLKNVSLRGSKILDYFAKTYGLSKGLLGLSDHPLFEALENYTFMDGSVSKVNNNDQNKSDLKHRLSAEKAKPMQLREPKVQKKLTIDSSVWELLDEIKNKFIGQEEAAEALFYNIINNQQLVEMGDTFDGQRSIIFMDGPTGTGKTAITREITEKLGIPFVASSVTNYSAIGYVGGDITDVLKELYRKAEGDLELAQRGIVVFDEFDKIAYSRSGGLEMKKAVQQQMLDFLGGGKYSINVGTDMFFRQMIEFDTSNLTFVCLGALTDVRTMKTEKKQLIGFGGTMESSSSDYSITPQDLVDIGLERELVGRFNTYLHTNEYSKESLRRILLESTISPLIGFRKWVEAQGKKLVVDDDVYDVIAQQAYELNTGARSLQTVMNTIRTPFIKEVLRGTSDTIHLDSQTVIKTNSETTNRKGRK